MTTLIPILSRLRLPAGQLALSLLTFTAAMARADDWPHWRGPQRNGISAERGWRAEWPKDGPPIAWKANVGLGFSSIVVGGGKAITLGHANETDTVFCFDATTGVELWKHSYPAELGDKYFEGGAAGSPTISDNDVFVLSRWGDLFCLDLATGKPRWSKNIQKETGAALPDWGFTGAPLLHGNTLLLNVGEAGTALDRATGKILWTSAKKEAGYSTPLPFERGSEWFAVVSSGKFYSAVNITTGREAWRFDWPTQYGVNAADPILEGDHVFVSTGYGKGSSLFKISGATVTPIWQHKQLRTQLNAAVLLNGYLYGIDGDTGSRAKLKCVDFRTGEVKWTEENTGTGGLTAADGKLIVLAERGELMVAPATPDGFKPTARAQVLGGKSWTVPVLANGRIYCRNSNGQVVCVDLRTKQ